MSVIANSTISRPSFSSRASAVALCSTSPRIAEATPRPTNLPLADAGRGCAALVPAEPGGTLAQRSGEMARGKGQCPLRIDLGIVAQTELRRIEAEGIGQLVHRALESQHAGEPIVGQQRFNRGARALRWRKHSCRCRAQQKLNLSPSKEQ